MLSTSPVDPILERVRTIASSICASAGIDLVDVAWTTEGGARTLRVTIERAPRDGSKPNPDDTSGWGVSLEDCADVSRALSAELDTADFVPGRYNLEVSSPGIERPLLSIDDFVRFEGFAAKTKLARPAADGQRVLRGRITAVRRGGSDETSSTITMSVDGKDITVPASDIAGAHLVYEMPGSKPRASGAAKRGLESSKSKKAPTSKAPVKKARRGAES